jgi:hypothetical protein
MSVADHQSRNVPIQYSEIVPKDELVQFSYFIAKERKSISLHKTKYKSHRLWHVDFQR